MKIAVIGATGIVGSTLLELFDKRNFPYTSLRCFASEKSVGKQISCQGKSIQVEALDERSFVDCDLAFFCAGSKVSLQYVPYALSSNASVIDASSAYRNDPKVPLIIPEINGELLQNRPKLVASPNCAATLLLMPLFPIYRLFGVRRIVSSTYQAASGGGRALMERLKKETLSYLSENAVLDSSYAFNLYLHDSPINSERYSEEERKIRDETQKILGDPEIALSATSVRVPVLRAHALSANVECKKRVSLEMAEEAISRMPGVRLLQNGATPLYASGKDEIFCSRVRIDSSRPNTLEFWAVGDQLLKGAALNCIQIAEYILIPLQTYPKANSLKSIF